MTGKHIPEPANAGDATLELPAPVLVDGHVHFYACFSLERFLDSASANFGRAAEARALHRWTGCLLLAERANDDWFRRWKEQAGQSSIIEGRWALRAGSDGITLLAERDDSSRLVLVAGRQIATREGLEVLALGCDEQFPTQLDFTAALGAAAGAGGVVVVPWGFGKWWGGRGRLVRRLIETASSRKIFLGDNGGRPRIGRFPRLLAYGRARGFFVLPGTDPLPFASQAQRVGSFGFVLSGSLRTGWAGSDLLGQLRGLTEQPPIYGQPEALSRFLATQARAYWPKGE